MKIHKFISFGVLLLSVLAVTSCEKYWWQSRTKEINFKIDGIELQAYSSGFNLVQPSKSVYYYLKFVEENLFELDMQCITLKGTSNRVSWAVNYGECDSEVLNRFKLTSAKLRLKLPNGRFPQRGNNLYYHYDGENVLITAELYTGARYATPTEVREYRTKINGGYFGFKSIKHNRTSFEGTFFLDIDVEVVAMTNEILDTFTIVIYNGQFKNVYD